jgi:hypothetical protein
VVGVYLWEGEEWSRWRWRKSIDRLHNIKEIEWWNFL